MKRRKKEENYKDYISTIILPILLIVGFLFVGYEVWKEYRDVLIENQKEQLLVVSKTLGKNIGSSLMEYKDNLEFLYEMEEEGTEEFYKKYLDTKDSFICNIFWEDKEKNMIRTIKNMEVKNPILMTQIDEKTTIWQYEEKDGRKYLVLKKALQSGNYLCLVIDEESYYKELISEIHIGMNGYVLIKNSSGRIVMHPDYDQWGIEVIHGRKKMFPDLDYSSLEAMVEEQSSGKSGVSEYYSYWWTNPNPSRVKKISAYAPAKIGNDFWVISAVIDYDDFYIPVQEGFRILAVIFFVSLVILLTFLGYIGKLLLDKKKVSTEVVYLKELNSLLEEVHRSEETIAHQQRLQIMGTMTGGIAHEFNNFLTPIMGYAELLMIELPEESEEYENAKEIYEASEKAKDVVRQISAMSRKNVETVYKSIVVNKMLIRAVKMLESICPAQIHLKSEIQLGDICILGNATQINQVILNICINAIHAIGRKEGNIIINGKCVERANIEKSVSLNLSGIWEKYVQIDIKDDGCGMDKDTLKQIFEPFFTTKKSGEGTGLGLSLAEQIIISHKGYVYAESEKGKGTIFHIFLPVIEKNLEPERIKEDHGKELQIVIADDNAKILQLLQKNFAKINLPITTCMKEGELRQCLKENKMDVLLIDETIEGSSGIDFCMAINGNYPEMLKIIMTDCITRAIVEAKQRKIIDGYIEKPVSDATILEVVRSCTQEYK